MTRRQSLNKLFCARAKIGDRRNLIMIIGLVDNKFFKPTLMFFEIQVVLLLFCILDSCAHFLSSEMVQDKSALERLMSFKLL
jgi:hypothetical protein